MIKTLFALLLLFFSNLTLANSSCDEIHGEQSYAPLKIIDGTVCLMKHAILDDKGNPAAEAISTYFIPREHKAIEVEHGTFMYDYDSGEIVDAFLLDINHDGKDKVVVIHSFEVRASLAEPNSSGVIYSVKVFNHNETFFKINDRASAWFGYAYSWYTNGNNKVYEFPYLTRQAIKKALSSPFISLMVSDEVIPVIVKRKSYFYENPMLYGKPTKYLITGDKATVDKYTAGWCQVSYTAGKKPLKMWMMCDALEVDTGKQ